MKNAMKRPPYRIVIDWSDEDQVFIARVPELDGVITHGETEVEALSMAHEAIDLHLDSLRAHKEAIPEPVALKKLSGQYPLRMGPSRHQDALIKAKTKNLSVNEYLCFLIDKDNGSIRKPTVARKKA